MRFECPIFILEYCTDFMSEMLKYHLLKELATLSYYHLYLWWLLNIFQCQPRLLWDWHLFFYQASLYLWLTFVRNVQYPYPYGDIKLHGIPALLHVSALVKYATIAR